LVHALNHRKLRRTLLTFSLTSDTNTRMQAAFAFPAMIINNKCSRDTRPKPAATAWTSCNAPESAPSTTPPSSARSRRPKSEHVAVLLEDWYRMKAREHFSISLERCGHGFIGNECALPAIQIKKMRTRWGSLSKNGTLTLNLSLVRAPRECIEYVITHELCHLKHDDHRSAFYKLLEKHMPDWERRKRKLELLLC